MGIELGKQALDVGIVTRDFERMIAFYRDVLGFPAEEPRVFPGTGRIHRLTVGESLLRLFDPEHPPEGGPGSTDSIYAATGIRYLTLAVRNIHEVVEACTEFGVNVAHPPRELRPGVLATTMQDPDGNWIELQSE